MGYEPSNYKSILVKKKDLIKSILNLNGKAARNTSESNIIPIKKSLWSRIVMFFKGERHLADQYLLNTLHPKFICNYCSDWFHPPLKSCQCGANRFKKGIQVDD